MVTLSAFADEISPDLDVQIDVLLSEGIRHLELRGVWDINVVKLTDEQLREVKAKLDASGIRVSSIGSPIGKIQVTDDFAPHLADFERALHAAEFFQSPYVRIFSFFIPEGENPVSHRDEVVRRMRALVDRAEARGITLLHENEKHIYGDVAERCEDILRTCASPRLRMAFDPANYVQCGVKPMAQGYPLVSEYIEYVHIKDALFADGQVVPPGQGEGEVAQLLRTLKARQYEGFLSIEPHLASAGTYSGFSGPDLFRVAARSLKEMLLAEGIEWN